jgi:hypothetical protein
MCAMTGANGGRDASGLFQKTCWSNALTDWWELMGPRGCRSLRCVRGRRGMGEIRFGSAVIVKNTLDLKRAFNGSGARSFACRGGGWRGNRAGPPRGFSSGGAPRDHDSLHRSFGIPDRDVAAGDSRGLHRRGSGAGGDRVRKAGRQETLHGSRPTGKQSGCPTPARPPFAPVLLTFSTFHSPSALARGDDRRRVLARAAGLEVNP